MKLLPLALAALATMATTTTAIPGYEDIAFHLSRDTNAIAGPSNPTPPNGPPTRSALNLGTSRASSAPRRRRSATSATPAAIAPPSPPLLERSAATWWDFLGGRKRRAVRSGQPRAERRSSSASTLAFEVVDPIKGKGKARARGRASELVVSSGRKKKRSGSCKRADDDGNQAAVSLPPKSASSGPASATGTTSTKPSPIVAAPTATAGSNATGVITETADGNRTVGTGKVMAGYWPDWSASNLPPEKIDFSKFDFINYAFALPTRDFKLDFPTDNTKGLLKRLVRSAHAAGSKVILSIGGWGGSTYFSPAVKTSSSRSIFIANIKDIYDQFQLDGIDLDWEYPGQGNEGNQYDPQDTINFQTFLQELRAALPDEAIISAAVAHQPWTASNGQPVASVERAAGALDFILIMNYDVWGSLDNPGANAPLADLCSTSSQPSANAAAGVKQWAAAGMPRDKILLGIPSYGYINSSSKRKLKARSDNSLRAKTLAIRDAIPSKESTTPSGYVSAKASTDDDEGEQEDAAARAGLLELRSDVPSGRVGRYDARHLPLRKRATLTSSDGSTSSGQINFDELVKQGALVKDKSTGLFVAAGGYEKYWDDCSDTPYLANGKTVVTYDDSSSLWDKGAFAVQAGIAGLNIWSIDGDTSGWDLVNSAIAGMSQGQDE